MRGEGGRPIRHAAALRILIGSAALAAPLLHSATDLYEWAHGGFDPLQLWLNYLAFLPMPWLLLGIYVLDKGHPSPVGLVGAVLYGASFTYFAHSTLYALRVEAPTYEALWHLLGRAYTGHGAMMILGGLLFAIAAFRAGWLPRIGLALFGAGLLIHLLLAVLPLPEIVQTLATASRNAGLMLFGGAVLGWRGCGRQPSEAAAGGG